MNRNDGLVLIGILGSFAALTIPVVIYLQSEGYFMFSVLYLLWIIVGNGVLFSYDQLVDLNTVKHAKNGHGALVGGSIAIKALLWPLFWKRSIE
ncbi:hypothetical protein ABT56_18945 [Photobacterium aquae]|uniref:Uncharacterized protein n=2 Tax=Photobacterium aquae TaxID=1195763 RepID=A0A0J1JMX4_9GAMM|nr:hypothetical protein ABT56_18945 [Photobacterium aquae]